MASIARLHVFGSESVPLVIKVERLLRGAQSHAAHVEARIPWPLPIPIQISHLTSPHAKPRPQPLQPLRSSDPHPTRHHLDYLSDLLQQQRPIQRIHLPVLPIPESTVVELVRVFRLHQRDGLLELVEVLLQDGVLERGNEGGQEVHVSAEGGDAVRVDFRDGGGEREGLWWENGGLASGVVGNKAHQGGEQAEADTASMMPAA